MSLDAWRYVTSQLPIEGISNNVAVVIFAMNWTNATFVDFVSDLALAVNSFHTQPGSPEWSSAEEILARVIELKEAFWPQEGEEVSEMVMSHKSRRHLFACVDVYFYRSHPLPSTYSPKRVEFELSV